LKFHLPEYAANQKNASAIVCPNQNGPAVILTKADFKSEQAFAFWKSVSDEIYRAWEKEVRREKANTVSLNLIPESAAALPAVEREMIERLDAKEAEQKRRDSFERLRSALTETQFRRLCLYASENRTAREISEHEGVSPSAVAKSIRQAMRKIAALSVR